MSKSECTEQEKIKFILYKALNLAKSIEVYLDVKEISAEFFNMADHIDWVYHFQSALNEFDKEPECGKKDE